MQAAYAGGTWRNLDIQQRLYLDFCATFVISPLPASVQTIQLYIQFLARKFKSVDSIRNYVHGVKILHIWFDCSAVQFQHFSIPMLFKGLSRLKQHMPKQALPITIPLLLELHNLLNLRDSQDRVYWCLFLLAFFLMARKSNLVPDSKFKFDHTKHLQRHDITLKDNLLLVTLKWSKTNQFGARLHTIPILAIPGSPLCPVAAYRNLLLAVPLSPDSPVFVCKYRSAWVPLSYNQFQTKLRKLVLMSGREPSLYSSHSFRRGGASFAHEAGVPRELIKLVGDWKSDAVDAYLHMSTQHKLSAARQISRHIHLFFR